MKKLIITIMLFAAISLFGQEFTNFKGKYLGQKPPGLIPEVFAPDQISVRQLSSMFLL